MIIIGGRFSELGANKTAILMKLISNQDIVKCLLNNEMDFLDVQLPIDFDVISLIHSQIFPYRFIPTIATEAKSFITMKFNYKPNGRTFKNGSVWFYIIVHNSLLRTSYGTLRYDFLVNKIDEDFNSCEELGFDKLEFYDMDEFVVNENYSGIYIAYKLREFQ